jgi:hypothetical protein
VISEALFGGQLIELVMEASILLCILHTMKIKNLVPRIFHLRMGMKRLYHNIIQVIGTKKNEITKEIAQGPEEKKYERSI